MTGGIDTQGHSSRQFTAFELAAATLALLAIGTDATYQPDIVSNAATLWKKRIQDVSDQIMQGAVLGPRDVRVEERALPTIVEPTDAVIRLSATCICGSDLWPYRGISATNGPTPMGHEYCGIVEEVGRAVTSISLVSSSSDRLPPPTRRARTVGPATIRRARIGSGSWVRRRRCCPGTSLPAAAD